MIEVSEKGLTIYQMAIFYHSELKTFSRQYNGCWSIMGYISIRVEMHYRKRRQCFFQAFSPLPTIFSRAFFLNSFTNLRLSKFRNTDMMSKIWTDEDTIIRLSRKHCWKGRNCSLWAISPSHNVFKSCLLLMRQNDYLWSKGLRLQEQGLFDKRLNAA